MNNYKIKMDQKVFLKVASKIKASNIELGKGLVIFKTNKASKKMLDDDKVEYILVDDPKKRTKKTASYSSPFIIGVMILATILYINTFRVSKIVFLNETPINESIENDLQRKMKRFICFDFLSLNLKNYSEELRTEYASYPWISIDKNGTVIEVNIYKYDAESIEQNDDPLGNIVAKKDGIIEEYYVYNGAVNLKKNQYVKAGDVLINSNVLAFSNKEEASYTSAKGVVFASTYETIKVEVPKSTSENMFSGKKKDFYQINFFSLKHNLDNTPKYDDYNTIENNVFDLFGVFNVKKIVQSEKCDIIKTYNKEDAREFAITKIENDFVANKTQAKESIKRIEIILEEESDDSFFITLLVKKYESIGVFSPLSQ